MKNKNVVITCPPCGENVAIATKRGFLNKDTFFTTPHLPYGALPPQVGKSTAHGFTLIELLVVVLIIGILAAVAVPQYQKAVVKAHLTQLVITMDAIVKAQKVYFLAHGTYANSLDKFDIKIPHNNKIQCNPFLSSNTISCMLYHDSKPLAVLQTVLTSKVQVCCSYSQTNFIADSFCAETIGTTSFNNGCGETNPCNCYRRYF